MHGIRSLAPPSRPLSLRTISSSAGPLPAGYCFVCDCERPQVTAGGAAGTADGDAEIRQRREHRGQLKADPLAGPPRVLDLARSTTALPVVAPT